VNDHAYSVTVAIFGPSGVRMRTLRTSCSKSRHRTPDSAKAWAEGKHGPTAIERQLGYTVTVTVKE
jgi:hypothetical protein